MERHIILTHELGVGHVVSTFVGPPPAFPIGAFARINPFLGAGNVLDGRVKPDVENFALHPGPVFSSVFDRNTPV